MTLTAQHVTNQSASNGGCLFDCCQRDSACRHVRNAGPGLLAPVSGKQARAWDARPFIFDVAQVGHIAA